MTSTPRIQNHNKPQKLLPIQRKTVRDQSQLPENQSLNDTILIVSYLLITLMYIFKCNVVNLYMCIYVHIDTEGLMED